MFKTLTIVMLTMLLLLFIPIPVHAQLSDIFGITSREEIRAERDRQIEEIQASSAETIARIQADATTKVEQVQIELERVRSANYASEHQMKTAVARAEAQAKEYISELETTRDTKIAEVTQGAHVSIETVRANADVAITEIIETGKTTRKEIGAEWFARNATAFSLGLVAIILAIGYVLYRLKKREQPVPIMLPLVPPDMQLTAQQYGLIPEWAGNRWILKDSAGRITNPHQLIEGEIQHEY